MVNEERWRVAYGSGHTFAGGCGSGAWEDVPRHLLEQIALEGYQGRWLSEAQIRRLLGYGTRMQVHGFLKAHGVPLDYTVDDLERDREPMGT